MPLVKFPEWQASSSTKTMPRSPLVVSTTALSQAGQNVGSIFKPSSMPSHVMNSRKL